MGLLLTVFILTVAAGAVAGAVLARLWYAGRPDYRLRRTIMLTVFMLTGAFAGVILMVAINAVFNS